MAGRTDRSTPPPSIHSHGPSVPAPASLARDRLRARAARLRRRGTGDPELRGRRRPQRTVRPATWTSYRSNLERHVVARRGGRELRQLGASHLNVLHSELLDDGRCDGAGGLSPRSVRSLHTLLHPALRDALRWGKPPRNPAEMADPPRSRAPEMKTWQKGELRRFLASVEDDRLDAAWLLVSTTGLRRGELLGLRWSDLDFEAGRAAIRQTLSSVGGTVTFSTPKTTKSRRSIALDPTTLAALRLHRRTGRGARHLRRGLHRSRPGLLPRGRDASTPRQHHPPLPRPVAPSQPSPHPPPRRPPHVRVHRAGSRDPSRGHGRAARARDRRDQA